jgi:general stress protein 26
MTAQLDKEAKSAIRFFTSRTNRFTAMGPATATFQSKGHDVFCRFSGVLSEETSRERLDQQWNNSVQAWFPGGKDDQNSIMLRMGLGEASIRAGELGVINTARKVLGIAITDKIKGGYADVTL